MSPASPGICVGYAKWQESQHPGSLLWAPLVPARHLETLLLGIDRPGGDWNDEGKSIANTGKSCLVILFMTREALGDRNGTSVN